MLFRSHPVEGFVAAAAASINKRMCYSEDMSCGPEDDRTHGPKCVQVGNRDIGGSWHKAGEDLRDDAVESEINEAETEGDANHQIPVRNR